MAPRVLRILQVSTADQLGGAERVAWDLHQCYRRRGHEAWLAVGRRYRQDPFSLLLPHAEAAQGWARFWWSVSARTHAKGRGPWRSASRVASLLAEPRSWREAYQGRESFEFPGTRRLLGVTAAPPDVVHCHNLHGGYFDLRTLPGLSRQVPVVLTLHDAWLLSGHCAHSFGCERWRTGCGRCPDLSIYPAIRRDATAENWRHKQHIYQGGRFYVASPCRWLLRKAEASILAPGAAEMRVIPYGVNLEVFHPAEQLAARAALGLPAERLVILFAANGIRRSPWKDFRTMREAVERVAGRMEGRRILFIALGERGPVRRIGHAELRFIPYQTEPERVAAYYQAADLYVHAARAETFPNAILEAMACGVPVVATAVGGIPEQVNGLRGAGPGLSEDGLNRCGVEEATGILAPAEDAHQLSAALERLMRDEPLRRRLGAQAAERARRRFDLEQEAEEYVAWYAEMLQRERPLPLAAVPA